MPYAIDGRICQDPIDGGLEISDEQYAEALAGIVLGKVVSTEGGFSVAYPVIPDPEPPSPLSKEQEIAALQATYESDRDKLNKAWLSAIIADGAEETARKDSIKIQMDALDAQLEADITTVLMEE